MDTVTLTGQTLSHNYIITRSFLLSVLCTNQTFEVLSATSQSIIKLYPGNFTQKWQVFTLTDIEQLIRAS